MVWNHPRCPRENAQVERSHGVLQHWVEPKTCPDAQTLQQRLDEASRRQREAYPSVKGESRLQAHPSLRGRPRPFSEADWQLERVCQFLAQGRWRRHAAKAGQISLYNRPYSAGRAWANQEVFVRFDPASREWVIQNDQGVEVARHPAKEITQETIQSLNVTHRKAPKRGVEPVETRKTS